MSVAWKSFEREVARRFGGKRRIRLSYGDRLEDVAHSIFAIECKYGKCIPKYCITNTVESYKDWILINSGYLGKLNEFIIYAKAGWREDFIAQGIKQALSYSDISKVPVLCVKPVRYPGFIAIIRSFDLRFVKAFFY